MTTEVLPGGAVGAQPVQRLGAQQHPQKRVLRQVGRLVPATQPTLKPRAQPAMVVAVQRVWVVNLAGVSGSHTGCGKMSLRCH